MRIVLTMIVDQTGLLLRDELMDVGKGIGSIAEGCCDSIQPKRGNEKDGTEKSQTRKRRMEGNCSVWQT